VGPLGREEKIAKLRNNELLNGLFEAAVNRIEGSSVACLGVAVA